MNNLDFSVKAESVEEYNDRLNEFEVLLNIWKKKQPNRDFEIVQDEENLKFKVKANVGE